jgi:hypothetical protein
VEKLGRGGSTSGVSRPRPTGIRASPPGSGVVPFSSSSRRHQIRVPIDCSGRSKTLARVSLTTTLVPTSPEPWEANAQSNHAYGISCLTRPISISGSRSGLTKQVPHGPSLRHPEQLGCLHIEDDGLGQKSGLILGRSITAAGLLRKLRGEQSDSPMSTDRICAPGNWVSRAAVQAGLGGHIERHPISGRSLVNENLAQNA